MSRADMLKLIEAGISAPSADNMQPWKFRMDGDSLELSLDRALMGLFFDPADVASRIGCGAVVENIGQYAHYLGLGMIIDEVTDADQDFKIRLRFYPEESSASHLGTEVFSRCTDRGLYLKGCGIDDSIRSELDDSVGSSKHYSLTFYDDPDQRKAIIKTVYQADTIRFSHKTIHEDFYDVLRFGDSAEKTKDGLAQSTLGIESFFIPVLRFLKSWRITRILNNTIGLHHMMALRGVWLPMMTSPSLVSLVHTGPADYLEFGRVMERFWLQATRCGLSVQPLGAFPLFLARLETVNGEGFSDSQIAQLRQLEQLFSRVTPAYKDADSQLVMLFRLGYSKRKPNRSLRRSIDTFVTEIESDTTLA